MGRRGTLLDTWMGLDKALHIWEERYPVGHTDGGQEKHNTYGEKCPTGHMCGATLKHAP